MKEKVVLITGASRGIGRSTAELFAKEGYNVIINYNNSKEKALELKEQLERKYNIKALPIKADISCEEEVKEMVEEVIKEFNHIDVLVNNASIAIDTIFEDKTVENFRRILDINLIGTFIVSKYVSKFMLEQKSGKIINISSTNGIDTYYPESMDYDASKAGVISLTKNLAVQLSPYINVNCVCPGWVNTDMNKELSTEFVEKENSKILLNRFAQPQEIAEVILFLASDKAEYINGTIIRVDGGQK